MEKPFSAWLAEKGADGVTVRLAELSIEDLPPQDVRLRVDWSCLNYKDALGVTGAAPIFRTYPMVPGIDLAGTVADSAVPEFSEGDSVFVTGGGVGESLYGGYAEWASLPADRLLHIPDGWSGRDVMAVGTAGFTSMLCVMALEEHGIVPGQGPILVTGAGGGVGSFAIAILHALGYEVAAVTGRSALRDYLTGLGADRVLARKEFEAVGKPLEAETWRGVIDSVGGPILSRAIAQMQSNGVLAICGLAGGADLSTSVYPFILRNVTLCGIDSVRCPRGRRAWAWVRLKDCLSPEVLEQIVPTTIGLPDVQTVAQELLAGTVPGRVLVKVH